MEGLNPRVQFVWGVLVLVLAIVLGAVASAILHFAVHAPAQYGIGVGGIVLVLGAIHTVFRYRIWAFEVQDDALFLKRGVLTRIRTVVPYVRIQHVDTQRNPLERMVGLSSVVVYTAGSRGADVTVPGLLPERATELQQRLRSLVGERDTEDAV
ncbi:MAG: PH domain-containing protein [Halodesulfurarchaeum sp.]